MPEGLLASRHSRLVGGCGGLSTRAFGPESSLGVVKRLRDSYVAHNASPQQIDAGIDEVRVRSRTLGTHESLQVDDTNVVRNAWVPIHDKTIGFAVVRAGVGCDGMRIIPGRKVCAVGRAGHESTCIINKVGCASAGGRRQLEDGKSIAPELAHCNAQVGGSGGNRDSACAGAKAEVTRRVKINRLARSGPGPSCVSAGGSRKRRLGQVDDEEIACEFLSGESDAGSAIFCRRIEFSAHTVLVVPILRK